MTSAIARMAAKTSLYIVNSVFFLSVFVIIFYLIVSCCIASHFTLYLIVEFVLSKYNHTRGHLLGPEVKRRQLYQVPLRKISHSFFADS